MENNNSVLTPQKLACLSSAQCSTDFLEQLNKAPINPPNWRTLFPIASEIVDNFLKLPQPLLFLNAQYWHAATTVVERCNTQNLPLLALQSYDQEKLFGRINIIGQDKVTAQVGEIVNLQGGLLVLHISPLLVNPSLWFLLKAFLLNQKVPTSAAVNGEKLRGVLPNLNDNIIDTKIILVANRYQLDELTQIDPDFSQISSLFAEISGDIKNNDENVHALYHYCQQLIVDKNLTTLTVEAFDALFTYLTRLSDHQKNIRFSPQVIESTLRYAQLIQSQQTIQTDNIDAVHILQALALQKRAQSNAQDFSDQALVEKQLRIQLEGESVGQINGMSVVELMGYPTEFGEIFRISASDMVGDGEIIDVERKVELAGNIHAKSTIIVQGYLNHFFTHIANFPLSCNVVFEQSYQESDGDSASLAILLAAASCYSQTPIKQNLFVTGALDQQGHVLAIGGINQKIEAITRLFTLGLLNEPVTVLMPQANQINLLLSKQTLQLIDDKKINIYPIQHSLEAFPFAMSQTFESVIKLINKRINFLHKEEEDEPISFFTKCVNLLR
ncbi:ATP-dependent protease [Psychromonas marina]|uniref:endopeptidase La n=1 Tax=Psychromonas marina TaxID=88364 RepID=A0ABQ6E247_9GAMM|nr:AAA family ATPase [Psychromonas marina]GLS91507.1 ATP-dependent protease [Psychromonas marina]